MIKNSKIKFNYVIPILISIILIVNNCTSILIAESSYKPVRDVIWNPLPSKPLTAICGAEIEIQVKADESASNWQVKLTSKYGSYSLEVLSANYNSSSKLWTLKLKVPSEVPTGLYDLEIKFKSQIKGLIEWIQPRCINITRSKPKELLIAHITDIHLPYGADVLARAVYELNLIRPSIIIVTGDLVDIDTIASAWIYAWKILLNGMLEVPTIIIPGNHDHAGDDAKNYMKYCGPLYHYTRIGVFHFIGLDTAAEGYVDMNQINWAENILNNIEDGVKIILFHHPFFSRGPDKIHGSYNNIEKLKEYMYISWKDYIKNAREILRLIEQYNVSLILSGHIHAEHYVIYNNKHVFLVNLPAGGSLREGDYWSYRLIKIDSNGKIKVYCLRGKYPSMHPSSYPIGKITYYYTPMNNGSSNAVSIKIFNELNAEINPLIEFQVKADKPIDEYKFYPTSPSNYEVIKCNNTYFIRFRVKVKPKSNYHLTLAAIKDENPPIISVARYNVINNKTISIELSAFDNEWGVKEVKLAYSINSTNNWNELELKPNIEVNRKNIKISYNNLNYKYILKLPENTFNVSIKISVIDFAGNVREESKTITIKRIEEKPEQPPPTEQPQKPPPEQPPSPPSETHEEYFIIPINIITMAIISVIVIIVIIILIKRVIGK